MSCGFTDLVYDPGPRLWKCGKCNKVMPVGFEETCRLEHPKGHAELVRRRTESARGGASNAELDVYRNSNQY